MTRFFSAFCTAVLLWFATGRAAADMERKPRDAELQAVMAVGGPVFLAAGPNYDQYTSRLAAFLVAARLRHAACFMGLEVSVVPLAGFGTNVLIDVYRGKRFRLHMFDPGVFLGFMHPLSVSRARRSYDLTFGLGGEVYVRRDRRMSLTLDWRSYLPDPYGITTQYAGFARPIYREALQGGYLWIGLGYSF